jgi:enoyl-[acyl-carrier-protein] reductase (NADH)
MLAIDLTGKRALVAGVSDDGGFGFAIAKALAEAGASICLGTCSGSCRKIWRNPAARRIDCQAAKEDWPAVQEELPFAAFE